MYCFLNGEVREVLSKKYKRSGPGNGGGRSINLRLNSICTTMVTVPGSPGAVKQELIQIDNRHHKDSQLL